jgi:hypothetical protein
MGAEGRLIEWQGGMSLMPALPGSSYGRFNVPLRAANKGNGKNLVTRHTRQL